MAKTNKAKRDAGVLQHFSINYGVDETRLEGCAYWMECFPNGLLTMYTGQRLCDDVGISRGRSITQCKKANHSEPSDFHRTDGHRR